ncbi:MAG TPA: DUF445 family protein [Proteobacteria bacterium]|nr:hypothetical protein BMS3Abin14_02020 [bacterium BMS3Abin14]HDL53175.1 DUF445 family protein [Pseudomonadota bacterium]
MPKTAYFAIFPLVGALVGWITNRIAIIMLFRPRKPITFLGLRIQGLIPRRRHQIAQRIAETVEKDLLTVEDLEQAMSGVHWEDEIRSTLTSILHTKGPGIFIGKIPGIAKAWEALILPQIIDILTPEISRLIGRYRDSFVRKLRGSVDIGQIVADRIERFEIQNLEKMVFALADREFRHIEWVGALTGAIIGAIQGLIVIIAG